MIKGKVNDLSVIDSNRKDRVFIVLVDDLENVGRLGWQHSEVSGVGCFFLKVILLWFDSGNFIFVFKVVQRIVLNFEFSEALDVGSGGIQIDRRVAWVFIDELGFFLGDQVILGDQAILKVNNRLTRRIGDRI